MAQIRDIPFGALKIFATAATAETLTSAAQQLGVSQSAVSQAIAQLEELTATDLVVRRSRPVRLTPAGRVMKDHADEILERSRRMLRDVAATAGGELPLLNIGTVVSFAGAAGTALMQRISTLSSQIVFQTGITMPLSQAFLSRSLDILISSDPFEDHPEFECHPLLRDPFVILVSDSVCGEDDPTAKSLAERTPFIRYTRQTRIGMVTDLVLRRIGIEPKASYVFDNTQALIESVQAGPGWAIAPSLCVIQDPSLLEGVRTFALSNGANARYLCLLARRNELCDTPQRVADICREIYTDIVLPEVLRIMPWLKGEARAVTDAPMIWSS